MTNYFPTVPVEAARHAPVQGADWVRPLVLVVDDEPLIAETLAIILNGHGMATLTAPDAAEALEMAALMPPELLIADLAMPGMNGLDMAIEIARFTPDCRVILFSGHASASDMYSNMLMRGHNFACLVKPVHPADLLECAFACLGKRGSPPGLSWPARSTSLYDLLSSASHVDDVYPASWNLTLRERLRPGHPLA